MSTWTWILIAVAVAAGLIALTPRKKTPTNNSESAQGTAQSSEQIANAGTDSEYSSGSAACGRCATLKRGSRSQPGKPHSAATPV